MNVSTAILMILHRDGVGYGLSISASLNRAGVTHRPVGQLYPLLRQMERDGLLKSHEGPPLPERGGRPRIYYSLTPAGQQLARVKP